MVNGHPLAYLTPRRPPEARSVIEAIQRYYERSTQTCTGDPPSGGGDRTYEGARDAGEDHRGGEPREIVFTSGTRSPSTWRAVIAPTLRPATRSWSARWSITRTDPLAARRPRRARCSGRCRAPTRLLDMDAFDRLLTDRDAVVAVNPRVETCLGPSTGGRDRPEGPRGGRARLLDGAQAVHHRPRHDRPRRRLLRVLGTRCSVRRDGVLSAAGGARALRAAWGGGERSRKSGSTAPSGTTTLAFERARRHRLRVGLHAASSTSESSGWIRWPPTSGPGRLALDGWPRCRGHHLRAHNRDQGRGGGVQREGSPPARRRALSTSRASRARRTQLCPALIRRSGSPAPPGELLVHSTPRRWAPAVAVRTLREDRDHRSAGRPPRDSHADPLPARDAEQRIRDAG